MSRASASGSGTWFDHLPFVLLGMRTSIREDSGCCPADLLYGAPLRLPGDCFEPSEPVPLASDFAHQLRTIIGAARPMPVLHHGHTPSRIHPSLRSSSHVFLRVDAVRRPLVQPYLGPFEVLERNDKTFVISQNNKRVTVTVDRLKPAHLSPAASPSSAVASSSPSLPSSPSPVAQACPVPVAAAPTSSSSSSLSVTPVPASGRLPGLAHDPARAPDMASLVDFPPLRSGRVPRPVSRYQA